VARQRNVKFVIGSSLNAGFISGSPRYNYGKTSWNIPRQYIEKRERLRAVAAQFGADLRTAALQFSAAPDVAAALIVGAHTEAQVLANVTSMQTTIPPEFRVELKRQPEDVSPGKQSGLLDVTRKTAAGRVSIDPCPNGKSRPLLFLVIGARMA
jgi:aryl-alcohol dehydrogenase-like predicted oxidoreductase